MKRSSLLAVGFLAACGIPASAMATCPPLSAYTVSGATMHDGTLSRAVAMIFADTAWKAEVAPAGARVPMSLTDVGGPLDKVLDETLKVGGRTGYAVSSTRDTAACVVHVSVSAPAPKALPVPTPPAVTAPASTTAHTVPHGTTETRPLGAAAAPMKPAPAADPPYMLKAGQPLSRALDEFAQSKGWTVQWNVPNEYVIVAPFPIPAGYDVIQGVTYVVDAYKSQKGLRDVTPVFHTPNRVVAIEPTTAAQESK